MSFFEIIRQLHRHKKDTYYSEWDFKLHEFKISESCLYIRRLRFRDFKLGKSCAFIGEPCSDCSIRDASFLFRCNLSGCNFPTINKVSQRQANWVFLPIIHGSAQQLLLYLSFSFFVFPPPLSLFLSLSFPLVVFVVSSVEFVLFKRLKVHCKVNGSTNIRRIVT